MKRILILALLLSFTSISYASEACFEQADNFEQGASIGGFDKEKAVKDGYSDIQDPAQDLMGCFLQTSYEGPQSVVSNHCGCKESVKELCKFKFDKGVLKISASGGAKKAWCVPFSFMAY